MKQILIFQSDITLEVIKICHHLLLNLFHIQSTIKIPIDMKKRVYLLCAAFLLATLTFTFWYSYQNDINQKIYVLEQKLTNVSMNP